MRELEVKVLNMDLDKIEIKLKALGAKLISKEVQINTLIDNKDNFIKKELDSYMRIRESKSLLDGKVKNTLTIKKNILRKGIRENIETNVDIGDKESMLKILENLGYVAYKEGYKKRTSYALGKTRFDLDVWDKETYPHPYMEIEVEHESDLKEVIKLLDIEKENISIKSIVELSKELKKQGGFYEYKSKS